MKSLLYGLFVVLVAVLVLGLIPAGAYLYEVKACHQRWPSRQTEYSLFGGCLVRLKSGEMVPQSAVKEISQ